MFNTENFIRSLVLGCAFALAACQSASPEEKAPTTHEAAECGCIKDAVTGNVVSATQLIEKLGDASLVIIGEEHTNLYHHQIEQWVLEKLAARRPQGSVLMEMIDVSQQDGVNRVKQASLSGTPVSASRAAETMRWNSGWPWVLYRGVVMTAIEGKYPLLAANISRQQVSALYKNPTFPGGERASQPKVHEALSAIIFLMHGGQIESEQVNAMMSIQQHRDRFMAEQLRKAPHPALLIAGGYHASKDIGVPLHLADLNAEQPVVLMLTTEGTSITAKQADYVWSVPALK